MNQTSDGPVVPFLTHFVEVTQACRVGFLARSLAIPAEVYMFLKPWLMIKLRFRQAVGSASMASA